MRWIFFFLFFSLTLFPDESILLKRLKKGQKGDFIVAEIDSTTLILSIKQITPQTILFEEISAPSFMIKGKTWKEWVKQKAPGASSWSMTEIDLLTGAVHKSYSFSQKSWIELTPQESLLASLLPLPMQKVPLEERKKIGPPPQGDEPDRRQLWNPPLIFEGEKKPKASFEAFHVTWPYDHSPLAGQKITLYFDQTIHFSLPYWIQVDTSHVTGHFRIIDSGKGLESPYRSLPPKSLAS